MPRMTESIAIFWRHMPPTVLLLESLACQEMFWFRMNADAAHRSSDAKLAELLRAAASVQAGRIHQAADGVHRSPVRRGGLRFGWDNHFCQRNGRDCTEER